MTDQPQLTIGVPAYNVEAYLERGLSTYDDPRLEGLVEVIVVNDGSTDGTRAIAHAFAGRRPRVFRVIDKSNGGHGSAVNAAMEAASGRYFRCVDGDDWVDTDALVEFARRLRGIETDLVVDVKTEVDMATGAETRFELPKDLPLGVPVSSCDVLSRADMASLVMIHTLTVSCELLRTIGLRLLEHTFYVDFEYVVKASVDSLDVTYLDLSVYRYLVGNAAQSVADEGYVRHWEDHCRVMDEMLATWRGRRASLDEVRRSYLRRRVILLANTHLNIALVFDPDRRRGLSRARAFRSELRRDYPEIAAATRNRWLLCLALHFTGVDSQRRLDEISARLGTISR